MTPEIKQRIEQIRRGEVPEGYKKTKVGIVPNEWIETKFSDLFVSTSEFTDDLEKYPLYSLTIEEGIIAKTERYERSHLVKKDNAYKIVCPNDFAYNPMNVRFGAVARHKGYKEVSVSGYYDIFTTKLESDLRFMDSFLISDKMVTYYNKVSIGSLVEKQRVHFSQFMDFVLPIPSVSERNKIADILSTQDKLIELKEKLIEEKKRQKKALMQQLVTGKKRLPGFDIKWQKKRIEDIATLITDNINPCDYSNELFDVYSLPAFDNNRNSELLSGKEMNSNKFIVTQGMILFNKLNVRQKRVWYVESKSPKRMLSSTEFLPLRIKGVNPKFLTQYLLTDEVTGYFIVRSSGTSNSQQRILPNDLMKHILFIPEIDEQNKIVEVLEAYDREIELLQIVLKKEIQKKKALMQLLLTGIVRVNI